MCRPLLKSNNTFSTSSITEFKKEKTLCNLGYGSNLEYFNGKILVTSEQLAFISDNFHYMNLKQRECVNTYLSDEPSKVDSFDVERTPDDIYVVTNIQEILYARLGGVARSVDVCMECGGQQFEYDKVDIMGDGVEKNFGKTAIVCTHCRNIVGHVED